jgi:hypothetical protein
MRGRNWSELNHRTPVGRRHTQPSSAKLHSLPPRTADAGGSTRPATDDEISNTGLDPVRYWGVGRSDDLIICHRVSRPGPDDIIYGPDNRLLDEGEVRQLAEIAFPANQVSTAVEVALASSGFWTGAWGFYDGDQRGLWQLDVEQSPPLLYYNLFDPFLNAHFAARLWRTYGWRAWPCAPALGLVQE